MLEDNNFLGGHLVGIGKVKANGEVIYNELDKPIHNRITSVGLDHLFQWAGTDAYDTGGSYNHTLLWVGNATSSSSCRPAGRAGALNYMKFGSGNKETSFTDTDLQNSLSSFVETKETSSAGDQQLNGTRINSFGNYSMRISHRSDVVSDTTTINEIGWFGGYTNAQGVVVTPGDSNTTMVMFSRVVLPSPIVLESGEALITTYQLDITVSDTTASVIPDFFGLKDVNGNTLQAEHKITLASSSSTGSWDGQISIMDYITSAGTYNEHNSYQGQHVFHAFNPVVYYSGSTYLPLAYSTTVNAFPNDGKLSSLTNTYTSTVGTVSRTLGNYTGVGSTNKYRDRTYVLGQYWPSMSDPAGYIDITYLLVSGHAYRFGYYDNGTWMPQAFRKYANQQITLTARTRFSTPDTTNE